VDYGESLEEAAVREAREETGLEVELLCQFYTYSAPDRDPRFHTITTVYIAKAKGVPRGADDAAEARLFAPEEIEDRFFKDIYKLEAGHMLVFDGRVIEKKRYWSLPNKRIDINYEEALEETQRLIRSSIKYRLLSDVEVGSFLSGGVDSSLVSSIMQQSTNQQIKTFTIGFEDKNYNEAGFAKEVAEHIGSEHYEYIFGVEDVIALMEDMDRYYDEPFGDSSALPTMLLSKFTKEKVSVALSGDGGDELFLGYDRYFFTDKYYNIFSKMPQFSRDLLAKAGQISGKDRLEKIAYPLQHLSHENLYSVVMAHVKPWQIETLFNPEFVRESFKNPSYSSIQEIVPLQRCDDIFENYSRVDFYSYLPDDILTKVDRASMRYSLEARVPLLDHRVVEFAYSLPTEIKLKNGAKSILRDILYKQVPKELIDRVGDSVPTILRYKTHADKNSLFHTPPTFGIYILNRTLHWLKGNGGIEAIAEKNKAKAKLLYDAIDNSNGYFVGHAQKDSRSLMNVSYNIRNGGVENITELEAKFVKEAIEAGMIGLKGHRSIGGLRASIYNAMTIDGVQKLVDFMTKFQKENS
jgi:asparagine synthase (glutamine-hydrolysing)